MRVCKVGLQLKDNNEQIDLSVLHVYKVFIKDNERYLLMGIINNNRVVLPEHRKLEVS